MTSKGIITIVLGIVVVLTLMVLYIQDKIVKYKKKKKATELLEKITDGVISKATLHKTILLDDRKENKNDK